MRWPHIIVFCLLLFALGLPIAHAGSDVVMTQSALIGSVAYTDSAKYSVTVGNNQAKFDRFCLSAPGWGTASFDNYILDIPANSARSAELRITPPSDVYAGTYAIEVTAKACDNPKVQTSVLVKITVLTEPPHIDSSIDLESKIKPGDYKINLIVKNSGKDEAVGLTGKLSSDLFQPVDFTIGKLASGEAKLVLQKDITINSDVKPGNYKNVVSIYSAGNLVSQQSKRFQVLSSENVVSKTDTSGAFLGTKYTITLTNKGNVDAVGTHTVLLPSWQRAFFFSNPNAEKLSGDGGGFVAGWQYSLSPGQSTTMVYTISYMWLAAVLILLIAGIYTLSKYYGAEFSITKSVIKGPKSLKVKLVVKSMAGKQVPNVTVTDVIATPLKPGSDYGTMNPSVIKKEGGHVRLSWKFDVLYPGEERVLTYDLRTSLSIVGEIRLPAAHVKFKTENGKAKAVASNTVSVLGKISTKE
ncbi:MAG: hypothetical protein HY438_03245 [DPANN group archaeon]|nr:hypothetical protein [DPANN group archaeon]